MRQVTHKHGGTWERIRAAGADCVIVFASVFIVAIYWQFTQTIGDPDGFYHARIAQFIAHGTILTQLPWMATSTLRDSFTDHHLLYHIALAPFVSLGNPLLGVKLAQAFFIASFFTSFYWFSKRLEFHGSLILTAILLFTSSFTFRINLIKANALSLTIFLFLIYALLKKKWAAVYLLSALYVWLYAGWPLALLAAGSFMLADLITKRQESTTWIKKLLHRVNPKHIDWRPLGATLLGIITGLIVNPYFPQNLEFYRQQIWQIAIVNLGNTVNVGGEWSSIGIQEVVPFFSFVVLLLAIGNVLFIKQFKRMRARTIMLFVLAAIAFIFTIKSRRYIELSAPLTILFAGSAWTDVFPNNMIKDLWNSWKTPARHIKQALLLSLLVVVIALLVTPGIGITQITKVKGELKNGIPFERYSDVSEWLRNNTPEGSLVVQSDWDDWPMLFYQNTHNRYMIGLDPTFMYNYNTDLYYDWADLTINGSVDNLVSFIRDDLGGSYIFIEKGKTSLEKAVSQNIYFRLVYEDDEVAIYALIHTND